MARKPRLGKTERDLLKSQGIVMPSITVYRQRMANDPYKFDDTSRYFSGSGHQVGIGLNTTSTVNALKSPNALNGEIRFKKDLIKGDKNINLPFQMEGKYYDADSQPLFSPYPQELSL